MTELEKEQIFHGCKDARKSFQQRNFKIKKLINRRSSYSNDQVEYEDLETGETIRISQDHLRAGLESGDYREGRFENCEHCGPGGRQ